MEPRIMHDQTEKESKKSKRVISTIAKQRHDLEIKQEKAPVQEPFIAKQKCQL